MTEEQILTMIKTMIDKWNLYTVEKMQLEEDLLKIFNKHCLDKQRVLDVLRKVKETDFVAPTELAPTKMVRVDNSAVIELIKEELGL